MNPFPLISVIIPVYNRETYLQKCLDVISSQTYKNLEIIVVNDGSTDNSMRIAKQYKTVKIIEHNSNRGQSAARNTGITNATGKYIHFMDDDDQINLEFYQNLIIASEDNDADISCCSMLHQKSKSKTQLFKKKKIYTSLKDKLQVTYVGKWGYVVRYLFKTDFIKANNLRFEEGKLIEDLPFSFAAVFYANKIVTVPDAKYLYVFNPTSSLNAKNKEVQEKRRIGRKYSKQFILNFAKQHGEFKIPGVNTGVAKYIFRKFLMLLCSPKTTLD